MTKIEWTGVTWNPTTGCDRISPGCDNCYALGLAKRLKAMGQAKYQADGDPRSSGPGFGLTAHPDVLNLPYRWRRPQLVFINSMSDLFHARVPLGFVRDVFAVIRDTPRHTYQLLTKRSVRMRRLADQLQWPGNLWVGVSVENGRFLHRVDDLRQVPAPVRFLSAEPLLGPLHGLDLAGVDWVIAGGESGSRARPMHPDWVRHLRDLCQQARVPFFFKQWGHWVPTPTEEGRAGPDRQVRHIAADGHTWNPSDPHRPSDMVRMRPVGKAAAGRTLDGHTWDQYPTEHHRADRKDRR